MILDKEQELKRFQRTLDSIKDSPLITIESFREEAGIVEAPPVDGVRRFELSGEYSLTVKWRKYKEWEKEKASIR